MPRLRPSAAPAFHAEEEPPDVKPCFRTEHGPIAVPDRVGIRRQNEQSPAMAVLLVDGASRSRTGDLLLAKQALYQLSYGPSRRGV